MQISDTDVLEFRLECLRHLKVDFDPAEARQRFLELTVLFESFAVWLAKEKAAGRDFPICEHSHVPEGTEPLQ